MPKRIACAFILLVLSVIGANAAPLPAQVAPAHSATLIWTLSTATDATGQVVQRATAAGGPFAMIATVSPTTTTYTDTMVSASTNYFYEVVTETPEGALASNVVSGVIPANPIPPGCTVSNGTTFTPTPIASQAGTFTLTFTATPSQANADAVVGLSGVAAAAYGDLAVIVRFNPSGDIDAYNNATAAYAATSTVPYTAGAAYNFKLVVNTTAKTYDAFVEAPGATTFTQFTAGYSFRSQTTPLVNVETYSEVGTVQACAVTIPAAPPPTPAVLSITTVSLAPSGSNVKITAAWKDAPTVPTNYALYGSGTKLLKSGAPAVAASYSVSWTGAPPSLVWFTVCDATGMCLAGHP